jgi:hypothetical protein
MLKRHRDHRFLDADPALALISIDHDTGLAQLRLCVSNFVFEDEFDLLCAVIRHMPRFIERRLTVASSGSSGTKQRRREPRREMERRPRRAQPFFSGMRVPH